MKDILCALCALCGEPSCSRNGTWAVTGIVTEARNITLAPSFRRARAPPSRSPPNPFEIRPLRPNRPRPARPARLPPKKSFDFSQISLAGLALSRFLGDEVSACGLHQRPSSGGQRPNKHGKSKPNQKHNPQSPIPNPSTIMKPLSYSLIAAAIACGFASAQTTAYTTPVGYETLTVATGFNYLGLRLQQPVSLAGIVTAKTETSLTLSSSAALVGGKMYVLEITNAIGVTQEFLGTALAGDVLTTPIGLSAQVVADPTNGDKYKIRSAPTLATTFGAKNSAGLAAGSFGPGLDQVWLPNPASPTGFDQYYFDTDQTDPVTLDSGTWANAATNDPVDGASTTWNYADGILLARAVGSPVGAETVVISGEVKTSTTEYSLAKGVSYVSSIYPVGATLSSTFGAKNSAGLAPGSFGPGDDQVWVPNSSSITGFDQYYFDTDQTDPVTLDGGTWANASTNDPVDGATTTLTSGALIVIAETGTAKNATITPPSYYTDL